MQECILMGIVITVAVGGTAVFLHAVRCAAEHFRNRQTARGLLNAIGAFACAVLVLAIVLPAVLPCGCDRVSARRNACINNLRQIDGAKDVWALEHGMQEDGATVTWANVAMYVKDVTNYMYCPAAPKANRYFSQNYRINLLGEEPVCLVEPGTSSDPDHSLGYKR